MLILASRSPRRAELLRAAGIPFAVVALDVDERPLDDESPDQHVRRLAEAKARAARAGRPGAAVLGADTVVVVDGRILGKPRDAGDAMDMLRSLSGRAHDVVTGVALIVPAGAADLSAAGSAGLGGSAGLQRRLYTAGEVKSTSAGAAGLKSRLYTDLARTTVWFAPLDAEEIRAYVASGEPMDKAGAYAVQGRASRYVERIDGSYSNVVGLPVAAVYRLLRDAGLVEL